MKKSVRMADIAERLGVSVAAVSKALADKPGISPELRVKVRQTALEIGYRAADIRKKPQRAATKSVAVVTAERFLSDDSFYLKYYKHISDMLQSNDYCGFFYSISAEDEENLVLPKALVTGSADGVRANVKFVMKTAGLPEEETASSSDTEDSEAAPQDKTPDTSFWDRVKNLFS